MSVPSVELSQDLQDWDSQEQPEDAQPQPTP